MKNQKGNANNSNKNKKSTDDSEDSGISLEAEFEVIGKGWGQYIAPVLITVIIVAGLFAVAYNYNNISSEGVGEVITPPPAATELETPVEKQEVEPSIPEKQDTVKVPASPVKCQVTKTIPIFNESDTVIAYRQICGGST